MAKSAIKRLGVAVLVATVSVALLVFVPGVDFIPVVLAIWLLVTLDSKGFDVGVWREGFLVPNAAGWLALSIPLWIVFFLIAYAVWWGSRPRQDQQTAAERPVGMRINGWSIRSFEQSYDELQASLTPEQREELRQKLVRLHATALAMQPESSTFIPQAFSPYVLRDRLHGLDYDGILALQEY